MSLLSIALVLFLIIDPLRNTQSFVHFLNDVRRDRKNFVIIRELFIALGTMLFFSFIGEYIFHILEIEEVTVYLSSGLILFIMAMKILFPKIPLHDAKFYPDGEPFIVPLAIPMLANPGLLATIMLYAGTENSVFTMNAAIVLAWAVTALFFIKASKVKELLGSNGLIASERLMGMILVLLSIQRFLEGIEIFITNRA